MRSSHCRRLGVKVARKEPVALVGEGLKRNVLSKEVISVQTFTSELLKLSHYLLCYSRKMKINGVSHT